MGVDPFIRNLVANVQLRPKPPDTYAALLRELSAIGRNINQLTYWATRKSAPARRTYKRPPALCRRRGAWSRILYEGVCSLADG